MQFAILLIQGHLKLIQLPITYISPPKWSCNLLALIPAGSINPFFISIALAASNSLQTACKPESSSEAEALLFSALACKIQGIKAQKQGGPPCNFFEHSSGSSKLLFIMPGISAAPLQPAPRRVASKSEVDCLTLPSKSVLARRSASESSSGPFVLRPFESLLPSLDGDAGRPASWSLV